ncbi:MAG TPA: HlyD family efflux transporter periplasmic adaptor subunit [Saprospiraceae bacterium]|nr:HlyD family efflux transporter periplasmic adaptor subunit [Saprospiraceae bacterium]HPI06028.1 HlyD family efflux transporter periplasmic adaptor subunit [Saprospiraceae bacterium]
MPNATKRYDADALLSHMPGGILKWGNTMFFVIAALLLCFAWIFRYPQTVQTAFSILHSAEPEVVYAPENGLLTTPLRPDSAQVQKGDTLALLESRDAAGHVVKTALTSPLQGRAEQYLTIQAGDNVQKNQPLFVVSSEQRGPVSAEIRLPVAVIGKIKPGRQTMLHFEAYPSDVYGVVPAMVQEIGKVSLNGVFTVRLGLPEGLKTTRQILLDPRISAGGRAEIVVDNPRLIENLIQPLQMILNKQKQQHTPEKEHPKFTKKGD